MKNIIRLSILLIIVFQSIALQSQIRVMTFNIRYDNPGDGKYAWENRRDLVLEMVSQAAPDIIGFQEVLFGQMTYLSEELPEFLCFGVGRDDGKNAGEFAPIFYKKANLSVLDSGFFWLSENPAEPGKGWDAACTRIVTWLRLKCVKSHNEIFVFNTHFDHVGEIARIESAKLLVEMINNIAGNQTVILTGDFNLPNNHPAYQLLTTNSSGFINTDIISEIPHVGSKQSFIGFPPSFDKSQAIDFIFIKSKKLKVKSHITNEFNKDGFYPSDHLPVYCELQWQ